MNLTFFGCSLFSWPVFVWLTIALPAGSAPEASGFSGSPPLSAASEFDGSGSSSLQVSSSRGDGDSITGEGSRGQLTMSVLSILESLWRRALLRTYPLAFLNTRADEELERDGLAARKQLVHHAIMASSAFVPLRGDQVNDRLPPAPISP